MSQQYKNPLQNLLRAIENTGIVSVYGIRYLTTGNVTQQNFIKYCEITKIKILMIYVLGMWSTTP